MSLCNRAMIFINSKVWSSWQYPLVHLLVNCDFGTKRVWFYDNVMLLQLVPISFGICMSNDSLVICICIFFPLYGIVCSHHILAWLPLQVVLVASIPISYWGHKFFLKNKEIIINYVFISHMLNASKFLLLSHFILVASLIILILYETLKYL